MLKDANGLVSGANENNYHYKNIDFTRDCKIDEYYDLRTVQKGEPDIIGGKPLRIVKAIELGHIFKLGTKYSEALGANFLDKEGKENPIIMGSYGIGAERILACFIEQNFDENGIVWKKSLTPFHVHIIGLNLLKFDIVRETAEKLHDDLEKAGFEVLFDDRNESPGVKFNDADLIGLPIQIIVGKKNVENGNLEIKFRETGEREIVTISDILQKVKEFYEL